MKNETHLNIRPAKPEDVPTIFALIKALAEYEGTIPEMTGNIADLQEHLFGDRPYAEVILAEWQGNIAGLALFFQSYSSLLTKPRLYLHDLFILPDYRRRGIGKQIFRYLARLAIERGYGGLEWNVLVWNEPAISFYEEMGATILKDWRICRLTANNLHALAEEKLSESAI